MSGILGSGRFQNMSWSLLALVWIPMFAFLVWGRGGVLNHLNMKREVADIEAEIRTLRQENRNLETEIRRLESDPSAYEEAARLMLLRKKPGEIVLYLSPETTAAEAGGPASAAAEDPPGGPMLEPFTEVPDPDEKRFSGESATRETPSGETAAAQISEAPPPPAPSPDTPSQEPLPTPWPDHTAGPASNPETPLPGEPGWLRTDPVPDPDRTPHTGNPLPGDPDPPGTPPGSSGSSGEGRSGD